MNTIGGYVSRQIGRLYASARSGIITIGALGLMAGASAQSPPDLPVNYWSCPLSAGAACSTGVYRDGLLIVDGEPVEVMIDADNNPSTPANGFYKGRETDVRRGAFPTTLGGGSLSVEIYQNSGQGDGYSNNPADAHLRAIDLLIGGEMAFARDLPVGQGTSAEPGDAIQKLFDVYLQNLRLRKANPATCDTASCDTVLDSSPGNPEANQYDVVRIDLLTLRDMEGFPGTAADRIACRTTALSISGTPELRENPPVGEIGLPQPAANTGFGYIGKPRTSVAVGNYGRDSSEMARPSPLGDCP